MGWKMFLIYSALVLGLTVADAAETPVEPILEYQFNETGTSAPGTGSDTTKLLLYDGAGNIADRHSKDAGGFSGQPGDRSLDNSDAKGPGQYGNPGGRAVRAGTTRIQNLKSFTLSGWYKTERGQEPTGGTAFLTFNDGGHGFMLLANRNYRLMLYVDSGHVESPQVYSRNTSGNDWVFFAVTYDGTQSKDNVKFYRGYNHQYRGIAAKVILVGKGSLDQGAVDAVNKSAMLTIGNRRNGAKYPFDGFLDNIRIYGSKSDAGGALSLEQLRTVQRKDLGEDNPAVSRKHYIKSILQLSKSGKKPPLDKQFIWGINTHSNSGNYRGVSMQTQLKLMKELGVKMIRWDWHGKRFDNMDMEVLKFYEDWEEGAKKQGIEIAPVSGSHKAMALLKDPSASLESIEQESYDFAYKIVKHFKGKVKYWEWSNETADHSFIRKGDKLPPEAPYPVWQWGAPDGSCRWHYNPEKIKRWAALFRGYTKGAKAADPEVKTLINDGWLHYYYIDLLLENGVEFDILAWHWYSDMGDMTASPRVPQELGLKGVKMDKFNFAEFLYKRYGKPIWVNEINRQAGDMGGKEWEQAEYVYKQFSNLKQEKGVTAVFLYELLDEPMGSNTTEQLRQSKDIQSHFGLLWRARDAEGQWSIVKKKPAFYAYKAIIRNKSIGQVISAAILAELSKPIE